MSFWTSHYLRFVYKCSLIFEMKAGIKARPPVSGCTSVRLKYNMLPVHRQSVDGPSTCRDVVNHAQSMWHNWSVAYSCFCCFWSIRQPWRRAKLEHIRSWSEIKYKKHWKVCTVTTTVCICHAVFFDFWYIFFLVMLHSLSYSDPLVNQSEFNNRQHHPHSGMCRKIPLS